MRELSRTRRRLSRSSSGGRPRQGNSPGNGGLEKPRYAGEDLREAVFRAAVERGWVLLELAEETASLEDVFVQVTGRALQ